MYYIHPIFTTTIVVLLGWGGRCGNNEVTCDLPGFGGEGKITFDWKVQSSDPPCRSVLYISPQLTTPQIITPQITTHFVYTDYSSPLPCSPSSTLDYQHFSYEDYDEWIFGETGRWSTDTSVRVPDILNIEVGLVWCAYYYQSILLTYPIPITIHTPFPLSP